MKILIVVLIVKVVGLILFLFFKVGRMKKIIKKTEQDNKKLKFEVDFLLKKLERERNKDCDCGK